MDEITFLAEKGVFIKGKVMPPVKEVRIRLSHKTDKNLMLFADTDVEGRYKQVIDYFAMFIVAYCALDELQLNTKSQALSVC